MGKKKLFISDERMLVFMKYCIDTNFHGVDSPADWCTLIGVEYTNLNKIKAGDRGFTKEHLYAAGGLGASMDYLFGFSDDMLRSKKNVTPMQLLKHAVRAVEGELAAAKASTVRKTVVKGR